VGWRVLALADLHELLLDGDFVLLEEGPHLPEALHVPDDFALGGFSGELDGLVDAPVAVRAHVLEFAAVVAQPVRLVEVELGGLVRAVVPLQTAQMERGGQIRPGGPSLVRACR
jgi:hypothetical protein